MQLNASLLAAKAHQTSGRSYTVLKGKAIGSGKVRHTQITPSVVKGPALCPSFQEPEGRPSLHIQRRTAC